MSILTPQKQPTLVDYGIHTEQSDLRVHVCVNAGIAYVYPTKYGVLVVQQRIAAGVRPLSAYQKGVSYATAEGYPVPPSKINGCLPIRCDWAIDKVGGIRQDADTSTKGRKAVDVVSLLLKHGWFPMWATPDVIEDLDLQIRGFDIVVRQTARIQVKCDYEGGEPAVRLPDGRRITGNLFLQIAELNPLRRT